MTDKTPQYFLDEAEKRFALAKDAGFEVDTYEKIFIAGAMYADPIGFAEWIEKSGYIKSVIHPGKIMWFHGLDGKYEKTYYTTEQLFLIYKNKP